MKERSRTEYSLINTIIAIIARLSAIVMGFITRVVFVRMLSENYVGINGLFSDILNILSLSELGIGTAISYVMYEPIANKNYHKQKLILNIYQKLYRYIALIVLVSGLMIIPFFDILIKNKPDVNDLIFIYLLYLIKVVISYLLIYKKMIIETHQMSFIATIIEMGFLIIQDVVQIIILIVTKNFILYLIVAIICTWLSNLLISHKANKLFPYIKEKVNDKLEKKDVKLIYNSIKAIIYHKISNVIINNTDNLIISSFVGIVSVGVYSNYYLLIGSIRQIFDQVFIGITASIGNLGTDDDKKKIKDIFNLSYFIANWLYGFGAITLYICLNPFVKIFFGDNYVFSDAIVLVLCLNFYIKGTRRGTIAFKDSMGLFYYDRYIVIVEAILNIVISLILVRFMGTIGVFIGTLISMCVTSLWFEIYTVYKYRIDEKPYQFYLKYIINCSFIFAIWYLINFLSKLYFFNNYINLLLNLLISTIIINLCLIIFYYHCKEYLSIKNIIKKYILKK